MLDNVMVAFDRTLKTLTHAQTAPHVGKLMRVNYSGEVAAQGLYLGAWVVSKDQLFQDFCKHAMDEEKQHLDWCLGRMQAYHTQPSIFNPLIYAGAFALGAASCVAGKQYALGFVEETEAQVLAHLTSHQSAIPQDDTKTHQVLAQMLADEQAHKEEAAQMGAQSLPYACQKAMRVMGKALTTLTYWI